MFLHNTTRFLAKFNRADIYLIPNAINDSNNFEVGPKMAPLFPSKNQSSGSGGKATDSPDSWPSGVCQL